MTWITAALLAALFAGITSILAKCGVKDTDSDIATGVRTAVVLVFAWAIVFITGTVDQLPRLTPLAWAFLIASGFATGASWLCYFKALSLGDVNKVVPVDKSSTIMAALFAIVLFQETSNLTIKLASILVIAVGTYLMATKKPLLKKRQEEAGKGVNKDADKDESEKCSNALDNSIVRDDEHTPSHGWLIYAVGAAIFAALTSILAKMGIEGIDSNLATAIRTCVVLVMAWGIVIGRGKISLVRKVRFNEALFLIASGLATGASWLFFYYAIQNGQVSIVTQIDKLSIVVSIAFASIFLHEKLSVRSGAGLALIVIGTAAMTAFP